MHYVTFSFMHGVTSGKAFYVYIIIYYVFISIYIIGIATLVVYKLLDQIIGALAITNCTVPDSLNVTSVTTN